MPYSYASRDTLKDRLQDIVTTDDAIYRSVLEAVTRAIDNETRHRFQPHMATRYQTPYSGLLLPLDLGLLAVSTSLKTDADGDGVYETTWAASDYTLLPLNAVADERPYTKIETAPKGTHAFPLITASVEIVGRWGYWEDLVAVGVTAEALDASETGIDVADASLYKALQTIICGTEQMYITTTATGLLTVQRGVNGTTAATHDTGATLSCYRYPAPVVEALLIQAVRLFKRKDTPFGVVGGSDLSAPMNIPALDPDVKRLLGPYTRMAARYA